MNPNDGVSGIVNYGASTSSAPEPPGTYKPPPYEPSPGPHEPYNQFSLDPVSPASSNDNGENNTMDSDDLETCVKTADFVQSLWAHERNIGQFTERAADGSTNAFFPYGISLTVPSTSTAPEHIEVDEEVEEEEEETFGINQLYIVKKSKNFRSVDFIKNLSQDKCANDTKQQFDCVDKNSASKVIEKYIQRRNVIALLLSGIDFNALRFEYKRFVETIKHLHEPHKTQLTALLFPMFVYICLTTLKYGKLEEGMEFFNCFKTMFFEVEGYKNVVEDLSTVLKSPADECEYLKNFWEKKTCIHLAQESVAKLAKLMAEHSSVLLPILHLHFIIEGEYPVLTENGSLLTEKDSVTNGTKRKDYGTKRKDYGTKEAQANNEKFFLMNKREKLDAITAAIQDLNNGPLTPPPFYSYLVEYERDNESLAGNESGIYIKNMGGQTSKKWQEIASSNKKPPFAYEQLIVQAILSSVIKEMTIEDICTYITNHYEYYRHAAHGWQEEVKNTLFSCEFFIDSLCEKEVAWKIYAKYESLLADQAFRLPYESLSMTAVDVSSDEGLIAFALESSDVHVVRLRKVLKSSEMRHLSSKQNFYTHLKPSSIYLEDEPNLVKKLRGHTDLVSALMFSPVNDVLFSASQDSTARTWCTKTWICQRIFQGHTDGIWDIDIFPPVYFASASSDGTACLWSLDQSYRLRQYVGHSGEVEHVRFHPNGLYLALTSTNGTINLWSTFDAALVRIFVGHENYVTALAFAQNGKYLISSDHSGYIFIWDIDTGFPCKKLSGHTKGILSLSVDYSDNFLASTGFDQTVRIWNIRNKVDENFHLSPRRDSDSDTDTDDEVQCSPEQLVSSKLDYCCPLLVKYLFHSHLAVVSSVI